MILNIGAGSVVSIAHVLFQHLSALKRKIKRLIGGYPTLFYPFYRFFGGGKGAIHKGTEIVIEGFPRSANTFAVLAFNFAQGRRVPMARHLHVESQIIRGVKLGVPIIILIRNPIDAIGSLMKMCPSSEKEYAMEYVKFYSTAMRFSEHIVFAEFKQVTTDFGRVIKKVNEKFSTDFKPFLHSKENVESVFQQLDYLNQRDHGGKLSYLGRPSELKGCKQALDSVRQKKPYIQESVSLYKHITETLC